MANLKMGRSDSASYPPLESHTECQRMHWAVKHRCAANLRAPRDQVTAGSVSLKLVAFLWSSAQSRLPQWFLIGDSGAVFLSCPEAWRFNPPKSAKLRAFK